MGDPGEELPGDVLLQSQIGHIMGIGSSNNISHDTLSVLSHFETFDPDNFFPVEPGGFAPNIFLPRGVFLYSVYADWAADPTGYRAIQVVNVAQGGTTTLFRDTVEAVEDASVVTRQSITYPIRVTLPQMQVQLWAQQTSGGTLNVVMQIRVTTLIRE